MANSDCFLREDELVIQPIYSGFEVDLAICQRFTGDCCRDIRHCIFLKAERIRSHVDPDAVTARFHGCKAERIFAGIPRGYGMFVMIIRQATVDH